MQPDDIEVTSDLLPRSGVQTAVPLQEIIDGLNQVAQYHPDEISGAIATTQQLTQFEGYDSEGFAAGVCFVKDLIAQTMRQYMMKPQVSASDAWMATGNAVGWASGVALAKLTCHTEEEE